MKTNNEVEITSRLRDQVLDLEAAVNAAKQEAVSLFKELELQTRTAKNLASALDRGGGAWAKRVSKLMDILGDCKGTMEGMSAIGLLKNSQWFAWDLEKVFNESENSQSVD